MKRFLKKYLVLILMALVLALVLVAGYFYKQSRATDAQTRATLAEVKSLTKKVGDLMILPENETPTIATVSDPDALRDQTFFADAKVGDKVLIYSQAKKAILYDPVQDKIITIAPLAVGDDKKIRASAPTVEQSTTSTSSNKK